MKKIQSKMKSLKLPQHFSHYKSMSGLFPDAQGQVTSQSVIGSGRISKSHETLCLSSLPAIKMKEIRSKRKALEYTSNFQPLTSYSVVRSSRNSVSFKHLCVSLLPARMKIQLKMKALEWP